MDMRSICPRLSFRRAARLLLALVAVSLGWPAFAPPARAWEAGVERRASLESGAGAKVQCMRWRSRVMQTATVRSCSLSDSIDLPSTN